MRERERDEMTRHDCTRLYSRTHRVTRTKCGNFVLLHGTPGVDPCPDHLDRARIGSFGSDARRGSFVLVYSYIQKVNEPMDDEFCFRSILVCTLSRLLSTHEGFTNGIWILFTNSWLRVRDIFRRMNYY